VGNIYYKILEAQLSLLILAVRNMVPIFTLPYIQGDFGEKSVFWEMTVKDIVRKKLIMNMCLILNGYRERAFEFTNKKSL
jgi:hypothetical protein